MDTERMFLSGAFRGEQGDTALARVLHAAGRLSLAELEPALRRVRAERAHDPHASLAALLVTSGRISREELEALQAVRPAEEPAPSLRWGVGERVAGYELLRELGRGGMGVVFRAIELQTGREVAIKGLLAGDAESRERFAREANAQARVDAHPNVVAVLGAGEAAGCAYLVLELAEGGSLEERLRSRGELSSAEAARVVEELSRGVAHVHAHGILHRDIKPANVLFDAQGTPQLVDFGLARSDRERSLTLTGQVLGTPAFMAPEQAVGLKQVDERTDVYGLGAILYTCLCGASPFDGSTTMEVLSKVLSDDPLPPSKLAPDVDPALEAICLRALAREAGDRYPSALALGEALAAWGADHASPALAAGEGAVRGGLVSGLVAGLALGVALGFWGGRQRSPAEAAPAPPTSPQVAAQPQASVEPAPPSPSVASTPLTVPLRRETPSPTPGAPQRADLERGVLVMVPLQKEGGMSLGWISEVSPDSEAEVRLLVRGHTLGPYRIPEGGFLRDGFGVGAKLRWAKDDKDDPTKLARVVLRKGPIALVERLDGERRWQSLLKATLVGSPVAHEPAPPPLEVFLAPWSEDDVLYPAVVIHDSPGEDKVRVGYLDSDADWIARDRLRSLPARGERVTYTNAAREDVKAIVVGYYPGSWLAEVVNDDSERTRALVGLADLTQEREDRER